MDAKPKVLYLAAGNSIHTTRWASAIAERGWDVHLATLHDPQPELSKSVIVHRGAARPRLGYFTGARWARRLWKELKPDLVHAHYASGYGLMGALTGAHPLLLSVWGCDVYDFPETSPFHRCLMRWNLKSADQILSTSKAMAERTRTLLDRPITVTPFGIDTNLFTPAVRRETTIVSGVRIDPADIVIGTIKTLEPKYGVEYLIDAFHLVAQRHPSLPLKLVIVGGGGLRPHLERQVCRLGIASRTAFTGPVGHTQVPGYTRLLDVGAYLSVFDSESFGVSVLEACACAKPVVVSNVGGLPEVVLDGITGLVVPPRSSESAAVALERLILDLDLRRRLGMEGRRRVEEVYSWKASVDIMLDIYQGVLEESREGRRNDRILADA